MYRLLGIILVFLFILSSCKSGTYLSVEEMLKYSERTKLPVQENYPDEGAVVLYEKTFINIKTNKGGLDIFENYHLSLLYFNDKAEDLLTHTIYLNNDRKLVRFQGRTIHPDGTVTELTKEDLHPTQVDNEIYKFTDDKSVKFTFPAVEKGVVLEFSYKVKIADRFFSGANWFVQTGIPKLYTSYVTEIPDIILSHGYNWNYLPVNMQIGAPRVKENVANVNSLVDKSHKYIWELKNIPALKREPKMPPYKDVARYVMIGFRYKNWNDLSDEYWDVIGDKFDPGHYPDMKKLAQSLVDPNDDEVTMIRKVFYYTQQNYRYISVDIEEEGYDPHNPDEIFAKKYGDCKDMSVMNVILLRALGIDARPALVNTKDRGQSITNLVSLINFNHMIAFVKTKDGKVFWLDSTGSSCPLGEVYPSIEGVMAMIINGNGKCLFEVIPKSEIKDNQMDRETELSIDKAGKATGHAIMTLTGDENLFLRSLLKDASENDMQEGVLKYVNSNTPGAEVSNLNYDDPGEIADQFKLEFDFVIEHYASLAGNLLIVKPDVFEMKSSLSVFTDKSRDYPIVFDFPVQFIDRIKIKFDPERYSLESIPERIEKQYLFGKLTSVTLSFNNNEIEYQRRYEISKTTILPDQYHNFLDLQQNVAVIANKKIVLKQN